jgi:hypothetical protein
VSAIVLLLSNGFEPTYVGHNPALGTPLALTNSTHPVVLDGIDKEIAEDLVEQFVRFHSRIELTSVQGLDGSDSGLFSLLGCSPCL